MKRVLIISAVVIAILAALGGGLWLWTASQIKSAFIQNPVIRANLGETEVTSLDLSIYSSHCKEGCERFTVTLKGEKGIARAVGDIVISSSELAEGILCLDKLDPIPLTENSPMLPGADGKVTCD